MSLASRLAVKTAKKKVAKTAAKTAPKAEKPLAAKPTGGKPAATAPAKPKAEKPLAVPGKKNAPTSGAKKPAVDFSEGFGTFKSGPTKVIWEDNKDGTIEVVSLRTPSAKRGQGAGRAAMQDFLAEADRQGLDVKLGASPLDKRTKLNKLVDFYKSLGFETTGKSINMAGEPEMIRRAQSAASKEKPLAAKPTKKKAAPVVKGLPNPLHEVSLEFGPEVARRLDGLVDMDAPLSEWREAATRLAASDAANASRPAPSPYSVRPAEVAQDPRIESRKGELGKIENLELGVAPRVTDPAPEVSIFDFEGHPFITSMSDLAAAGDDLISINDVPFRVPFSRRGGQGYMFDNPGSVWASERKPAEKHVELAKRLQELTGKDVLYMPWTMGPNAVRFSHMPRGIQYSYADAALDAGDRNALASEIRTILPDWQSFEDPDSAEMFMRAAGKSRGALNTLMDRFRTRGGLGIGEATYAATDLSQIGAPLTTLRNVGIIDPRFAASPSSHQSYDYSIPGRGVGVLKEKNLGALALTPDVMKALGYATPFDFPVGVQPGTKSPLRAMQMKPQGGVLDYDTLRFMERLIEDSE